MTFAIYYRPSDGEIMGWTTSHEPAAPDGLSLVEFDEPFQPEPLLEKFDTVANAIVEKTAEEQRLARLPKLHEVRQAIWSELERTDQYMMSDYPIDDFGRDAWRSYRKALRGLTGDVADMIEAWPTPPDGTDPITALRKRL